MAEEVKETKEKANINNKKNTRKITKKNDIPKNNRFTDVIEKMEEETKKVQKKEKTVEKKKETVETESKIKIETSVDKKTKLIKKTQIDTELETIEKQMKKNNNMYKEKITEVYKDVFINIMYANIIVVYFILLILGYKLLEKNIFLTTIKVLSMVTIIADIVVLEIAYKKDSGKYAVKGIELMILAITTLVSLKIYMHYNNKFVSAITSIALLFAIYYVGKSIVIYMKQKREAKKYKNDIRKIAKK